MRSFLGGRDFSTSLITRRSKWGRSSACSLPTYGTTNARFRVQGIFTVGLGWKTSCERVMIWKLLWTLQAYKQLCMHTKYVTIYAATTLTACSSQFVTACIVIYFICMRICLYVSCRRFALCIHTILANKELLSSNLLASLQTCPRMHDSEMGATFYSLLMSQHIHTRPDISLAMLAACSCAARAKHVVR